MPCGWSVRTAEYQAKRVETHTWRKTTTPMATARRHSGVVVMVTFTGRRVPSTRSSTTELSSRSLPVAALSPSAKAP